MPVELIPWLAAAVLAGAGAGAALSSSRRGHQGSQIAAALGLAGALIGLGWRAWAARAWPGHLPADALALLAAGALVIVLWSALQAMRRPVPPTDGPVIPSGPANQPDPARAPGDATSLAQNAAPDVQRDAAGEHDSPEPGAAPAVCQPAPVARDTGTSLALFGVTALLAIATLLAWRTTPSNPTWAARAPLFGLRSLLAAPGLGGWLAVLAFSAPWAIRVLRRRQPHGRPADDPGRPAALLATGWLTAALLAGAAWQLLAHAAPWQIVPAALWHMVAWLLGVSYLHSTSNWRPVAAPAWLATLLAGLALAAAIAAALQAASWLL